MCLQICITIESWDGKSWWIKDSTWKTELFKGYCCKYRNVLFVCLMVFSATFNNISVTSWRSVLLVEETRWPGKKHWPVASHWQTSHIMLYTSLWSRFELTTLVVIGTGCIGSCKSNYHTITVTTAPINKRNNILWNILS